MKVEDQAVLVRAAIEKTYRERSRGFLAWAKKRAPDSATAEDALQDAFIRAIANADALSMVQDLAGWIFSVLRNRLIDLWRGQRSRQRAGAVDLPAETLEEIAAARPGPERRRVPGDFRKDRGLDQHPHGEKAPRSAQAGGCFGILDGGLMVLVHGGAE